MKISKRIDFVYYYAISKLRKRALESQDNDLYFKKHADYGKSTVYSAEAVNKILFEWITEGIPFMAGRFGATELSALKIFDFEISSRYEKILAQMQNWSGFFPTTLEAGKKFRDLMISCIPEADILGVWGQPFEDYYMKYYGREQLKSVYLFGLEPWSCGESPWSAALKGKKMLIIHPFAETIKTQYNKREKIFPAREILPEFQLEVLKAVQTIAGERDNRFQDWFEALDWMYKEALGMNFDIAIIGCGAYGFPLAVKLKKAGKQAIHLGGATQLLFGIKGKRWESDPAFEYVQKFFNDSWVYPDEAERPQKAHIVEGGCYW